MLESVAWLATPVVVAIAAIFGATWGSFFNVCIARVPAGLSVVRPGSRCGACGAPVRAFDNVPILSYFWLRGRCRACAASFSLRYPFVEALGALFAAVLWWQLVAADPTGVLAVRLARFVYYFAFVGTLVVLAFIDLETWLLPDVITLPAIAVFFLAGFGVHEAGWLARAVGAVVGYGFVRLISDFYHYVLKREGMGLGDGKLLALIGAALGVQALPIVVFAGSILGALISLPLVLLSRRRRTSDAANESLRDVQVPFGPFLALGALIYMFFGRWLLRIATGASF
ncbi:MAG: peptidase domain protein [Myxococcales bacterium]|nr:peptidase domain protein [Myxococcales bacterium]